MYIVYFFDGLECVGFFAYVAHLRFLNEETIFAEESVNLRMPAAQETMARSSPSKASKYKNFI